MDTKIELLKKLDDYKSKGFNTQCYNINSNDDDIYFEYSLYKSIEEQQKREQFKNDLINTIVLTNQMINEQHNINILQSLNEAIIDYTKLYDESP